MDCEHEILEMSALDYTRILLMSQPRITQVINYLFHSNKSISHDVPVYSVGLIYYIRYSDLGPGEMARSS